SCAPFAPFVMANAAIEPPFTGPLTAVPLIVPFTAGGALVSLLLPPHAVSTRTPAARANAVAERTRLTLLVDTSACLTVVRSCFDFVTCSPLPGSCSSRAGAQRFLGPPLNARVAVGWRRACGPETQRALG